MTKQRIVFCTYPSIYSSIVFEKLLACDAVEVVGVVASSRQFSRYLSSFGGMKRMLRQSGFHYAFYYFVITYLAAFLGFFFKRKSVKRLAKKHKIAVYTTRDINGDDGVEFIGKTRPDSLVAAHFNQLIKKHCLEIPRSGAINIHPSLLPDYQGVDPVFYAMLRGEKTLGVTLHQMSTAFDRGEILDQQSLSLSPDQSLMDVQCQLFERGGNMACEYLRDSRYQQKDKVLQIDEDGVEDKTRYDSWPRKYVVDLFRFSGGRLFRFSGVFKERESNN